MLIAPLFISIPKTIDNYITLNIIKLNVSRILEVQILSSRPFFHTRHKEEYGY